MWLQCAAVSSLSSLKELNVANNKLSALPREIGHLKELQRLYADNNAITALPGESWTKVCLFQSNHTHLFNEPQTTSRSPCDLPSPRSQRVLKQRLPTILTQRPVQTAIFSLWEWWTYSIWIRFEFVLLLIPLSHHRFSWTKQEKYIYLIHVYPARLLRRVSM